MSYLHDPSNPRHARMFELLRQTQQATRATQRINIISVNPLDEQVAQKIKESARHSFRLPKLNAKQP